MILRLDGKLILVCVELTETNVDLEEMFENFENAFEQDAIVENMIFLTQVFAFDFFINYFFCKL
jgi:hypothetical protein